MVRQAPCIADRIRKPPSLDKWGPLPIPRHLKNLMKFKIHFHLSVVHMSSTPLGWCTAQRPLVDPLFSFTFFLHLFFFLVIAVHWVLGDHDGS